MENPILKIKDKLSDLKSSSGINPHKHWSMLLAVSFLSSIFLIAVSVYLLYGIKNDQIFNSYQKAEGKSGVINESLLKNFQDYVSSKEKVGNNLKLNPINYKDPSI
jgi:hypothetical protein